LYVCSLVLLLAFLVRRSVGSFYRYTVVFLVRVSLPSKISTLEDYSIFGFEVPLGILLGFFSKEKLLNTVE